MRSHEKGCTSGMSAESLTPTLVLYSTSSILNTAFEKPKYVAMADPLSITASIVTLIQVAVQITTLVKQFRDEVSGVDSTLNGLLSDVEGFLRVLEAMKETFEQGDIKANLQVTGHVGGHWKNLARSLNDGTAALKQLHDLLDGVNKSRKVLDGSRKWLRLKAARERIVRYQEQIQSYRSVLQLSLSTMIL